MLERLQTDQGVIRKVLRGNKDAFGVLIDRYGRVVYGVAYAHMGNTVDAEDVTQEAFVRLYQWLDRISGRRSVGPWLIEVARNAAVDLLRRRQREKALQKSATGACAARDDAREELRQLMWEELSHLDEAHREVLVLHYFQNTKIRDIGRLLGISTQTAAKRLQRARDELGRRMLATAGEEMSERKRDIGRRRRVLAVIAVSACTWKPSAAMAMAGAAVTGASAIKVTAVVAAMALVAALAGWWGWDYFGVSYETKEITSASTFEATETELKPEAATQGVPTETNQAEMPRQVVSQTGVEVVPSGFVIYGLVLDRKRQPAPGAVVTLKWGAQIASVKSDASGKFVFERVPRGGEQPYQIEISAETRYGFAGTYLRSVLTQRSRYIELILEPVASLTGRVVDMRGNGIVDAIVQGWSDRSREVTLSARSNQDGTFELKHLAIRTKYLISAGKVGYLPFKEERLLQGSERLTIRLEDGSGISGRLLHAVDGRPLAGVQVEARNRSFPHMGNGEIRLKYGVCATDAEGTFNITGLEPSVYVMNIKQEEGAPGYVLENAPTVPLGDAPYTGVELRAREGAMASGRVVDAAGGESVAGADVAFTCVDWKFRAGNATTGADGSFTCGPLAAMEYKLSIHGKNIADFETNCTVPTEGLKGAEFQVTLIPAIRGKVINQAGLPVAGVAVFGVPAFETVTTDSAGEFVMPAGPQGRDVAYLQAYDDGRVSKRCGPAKPGSYQVLTLLDASRIEGMVVDTAGEPIGDALVAATPDSADELTIVTSDRYLWMPEDNVADATQAETSDSGAFVMDPVLPGPYEIQIYLPSCKSGYPAATAKANVAQGRTLKTRLVVDTSEFGGVEGTVLIGGTPVSGATIRASAVSDSDKWLMNSDADTDSNGSYSMRTLRPGPAKITLIIKSEAGEIMRDKPVEIAAGEMKTVNFELEGRTCGIEGTITLDGEPVPMCNVRVARVDLQEKDSGVVVMASMEGEYRVSDLQEGQYALEVRDFVSGTVYENATVDVKNGEMSRRDFELQSGSVEGTVAGLANGERATVAIFKSSVDAAMLSSFAPGIEEHVMATAEVTAGERFSLKVPPGTYYMGAAAIPTGGTADRDTIVGSMTKGRYEVVQVEVVAGRTTELELTVGSR